MLAEVKLENLIALSGITLRGAAEKFGPCPRCGGDDRFHVKRFQDKDYFFCRVCHPNRGDAIDYARWLNNMGFREAVRWILDNAGISTIPAPPRPAQKTTTPDEPHSFAWQRALEKFVKQCHEALGKNAEVLEYLRGHRGLNDDTINIFGLGFNPENQYIIDADKNRLFCARGIVIPCFVGQQLQYVQIRRPNAEIGGAAGKNKYAKVTGSRKALFNAAAMGAAQSVVVVGGEFDAMLGQQFAPPGMAVVTLGSETNKLSDNWLTMLREAKRVTICMDNDAEGDRARERWHKCLPSAQMMGAPNGKDLTEFWQLGGNVKDWLTHL